MSKGEWRNDQGQVINRTIRRYLTHLEIINEVGNGCMYVKDLVNYLASNLNISNSQGYRHINTLEKWGVIGSTNTKPKAIYIKSLGYKALGKEDTRELAVGSNKLNESNIRMKLFRTGEEFFLRSYQEEQAIKLGEFVKTENEFWYTEIEREERLRLVENIRRYKKNLNIKNINDMNKNNIFIQSVVKEEKRINLALLLYGRIEEQRFAKHIRDIEEFVIRHIAIDVKRIQLTVYASFNAKYLLKGIFRRMKNYGRLTQFKDVFRNVEFKEF